MYYLCIRLQINISVLFCSVLFCSVLFQDVLLERIKGRGGGKVTGILGLHNQWRMFPICCNLRNEPN